MAKKKSSSKITVSPKVGLGSGLTAALGSAVAQTVPIKPPPGSYDPNLDAQERASQRGLGDLTADTTQQRTRNYDDLQLALGQIGTQRTRNTEDYTSGTDAINRSSDRSLADLLQARSRTGEDYNTSLQSLARQYQQLGDVQTQSANKAGLLAGGASAQSARKRAANQALDQAPIDTAYSRFKTDSATSQTRLGEDKSTALGDLLRGYTRSGQDLDTQTGSLGLNYQRAGTDLTDALTRAGRENTQFGLDVADQRQFQYGGPVLTATRPPAGTQTGGDQHPTSTSVPNTLTAAPGAAGVKRKRKGKTVTYTNSVTAP